MIIAEHSAIYCQTARHIINSSCRWSVVSHAGLHVM